MNIRRFNKIAGDNTRAVRLKFLPFHFPFLLFSFVFPFLGAHSQNLAIISPEKTRQADEISERVIAEFVKCIKIVDRSLSTSIFDLQRFETPFNLSVEDSKNFGTRVGANFFLLINTDTLRRTSFEKEKYFESYSVFFLVSSRTGRLIFWKILKFEEDTEELSRRKLFDSMGALSREVLAKIDSFGEQEILETESDVDDLPESEINGLRPPMPYRRIKPKHTNVASIYDVLATVDVAVEIDAAGKVISTEVRRWAGFGLDESAVEAIKKMKWRPADQDGRTLAMRILLRYNFRNIETDE